LIFAILVAVSTFAAGSKTVSYKAFPADNLKK